MTFHSPCDDVSARYAALSKGGAMGAPHSRVAERRASAARSAGSSPPAGATTASATPRTRVPATSSSARVTKPASGRKSSRLPVTCAIPETLPSTSRSKRPERVDARRAGRPRPSRWPTARRRGGSMPSRGRCPSRRRASRSGGCTFESTNERTSTSAPAMPGLAVVPVHRHVGVALRESLAEEADVGEVALGLDADVARAALVLGAAEGDVHRRRAWRSSRRGRRSAGPRRARTSRAGRAARSPGSRPPRRRRSRASRRT